MLVQFMNLTIIATNNGPTFDFKIQSVPGKFNVCDKHFFWTVFIVSTYIVYVFLDWNSLNSFSVLILQLSSVKWVSHLSMHRW